jgi:hypothetical protein
MTPSRKLTGISTPRELNSVWPRSLSQALRNGSGSFATLAAILRASSLVSILAVELRRGSYS